MDSALPEQARGIADSGLSGALVVSCHRSGFTQLLSGEPPVEKASVGYVFSLISMHVEVEGDAVVAVRQLDTS